MKVKFLVKDKKIKRRFFRQKKFIITISPVKVLSNLSGDIMVDKYMYETTNVGDHICLELYKHNDGSYSFEKENGH